MIRIVQDTLQCPMPDAPIIGFWVPGLKFGEALKRIQKQVTENVNTPAISRAFCDNEKH